MSAPLIGSDGREVPVQSPEQAAELFRSGQAGYAPGTRVPIVRDGAVKSVLAEELNQALDTGARIAMREEVEQERIRRRTESGEGQAVTAVGSALNMAATLNAAPALDNAIAPEEQRGQLMERQRQFADMRELNPGMATSGDVVGAVANAALVNAALPGIGALTGVGALARGAVGVEAAVASRLAGRIGTGMLAKATAKAAGRAVAGAAEGAVTGTINAFSDAAIQNKELTSEALFDSVKNDVFYGTVGNVGLGTAADAIGAGLSATNKAARGWLAARASAKGALGVEMPAGVAGAAADAATPPAPKGLTDKATELFAEQAELSTGVPKETTMLFLGSGQKSEAARALLKNADEVTEAATRRGRALLDEADDLANEVSKGTFGSPRADLIRRGAAGMDAEVAAKEAFDRLSFIEAQAEEMVTQKGVWGKTAKVADTLNDARLVRERIKEVLAKGGEDAAGDVANELNYFKQRVGKRIDKDTLGFSSADTSANERIRQWYDGGEDFDGLKGFLEREDIFGASGKMMAEVNAAASEYIGAQDDFRNYFLTKSGRDGFKRTFTHDPAKLDTFLGNLGRARNDLVDETLTKKLAAERNFIAVAEKYIDLAETDPGLFAKSRKTADELDEYLADVREKVATINDGKRLQAEAQGIGFGKLSIRASTALQGRSIMDRARKRLDSYAGGAAESIVRRARRAVRSAERSHAKTPVLRGSALAVAFHEKSGRVSDAVATGAASARADRLAGEYAPASAEVSAGMRANADRATSFLQSKLPPGGRGTAAFQYLKKRPVPEMEMRRFLDYVYAVENPMGVLEAVKRGDYRPEHIEALRVVYPATFAAVRDRVAAQLADLKEPPPYESRIELFRLFGIAADPSLSPEFLASMQSLSPGPVPGQNPQKPKAGSSSSRLAAMSVSQTERTLTR